MEDSVERKTLTTAICFGRMTKTQISVNLKELKEREKYAI
jgi:hypothetical protein